MARSRPLRILLTEGASTSAREAVTALGLAGHFIEIMDPDAHCICRFSRFVDKVHRCPPLATDPKAYLEFALGLLETGRFDVLLPIHEQGMVFAKARARIPPGVGIALPDFDVYLTAHGKATFSGLLTRIGVSQPRTHIVHTLDGPLPEPYPFIVKQAMSTASRSVHIVHNDADLAAARAATAGAPGEFLVQELIHGDVEHAQALFDHGRFVAMMGYRQIIRGAGGGEALKESIWRPRVADDMRTIGAALNWHGALSVDYLWKDDIPYFVDSNPRLVEPMSAHFAGLDLAGMLVRLSLGEHLEEAPPPKTGVRTRLSLQALLGKALTTHSRIEIVREIYRFLTGSGPYEGSVEEFTPVKLDWMAAVPVGMTAFAVLLHPGTARILPSLGWGAGLLTPEAVRIVRDEIS